MNNALNWMPGVSSFNGVPASLELQEVTLDSRLDTMREVVLTLLHEVESLKGPQPARGNGWPKLHEEVRRFESDLIRAALSKTGGNQSRAARLLGVKHTTLNAKIKRYRISFDMGGADNNEVGDQEI